MLENIMIELQPALINIAIMLLTALASWLGVKVKAFLDTKEKRAIVEATVKYVEQVGKSLGSDEKLELAKEKALKLANEKGLKLGEVELEILIEAFVNTFYEHYEMEV